MRYFVIKLAELASGHPSEEAGKYVVEYDPSKNGYRGHVRVSESIEQAARFSDMTQLFDYYKQSFGTRPDGLPNRPLTAWSIEVVPITVEP